VHERKPDLVFTIVGRDPAPAVRQLASISGVEVTGSVQNVRPYYREAIAAVVPLKVGGGSRLKILEAMAAGVPVVSTTRGAEGLHVRNGENILLVDATKQLAEPIMNVIDKQELRQRLTAGGRALVSERYDWTRLGAALLERYQRLVSEQPAK
jgi:glycosyltransferase involved in cell wall biosynthesis